MSRDKTDKEERLLKALHDLRRQEQAKVTSKSDNLSISALKTPSSPVQNGISEDNNEDKIHKEPIQTKKQSCGIYDVINSEYIGKECMHDREHQLLEQQRAERQHKNTLKSIFTDQNNTMNIPQTYDKAWSSLSSHADNLLIQTSLSDIGRIQTSIVAEMSSHNPSDVSYNQNQQEDRQAKNNNLSIYSKTSDSRALVSHPRHKSPQDDYTRKRRSYSRNYRSRSSSYDRYRRTDKYDRPLSKDDRYSRDYRDHKDKKHNKDKKERKDKKEKKEKKFKKHKKQKRYLDYEDKLTRKYSRSTSRGSNLHQNVIRTSTQPYIFDNITTQLGNHDNGDVDKIPPLESYLEQTELPPSLEPTNTPYSSDAQLSSTHPPLSLDQKYTEELSMQNSNDQCEKQHENTFLSDPRALLPSTVNLQPDDKFISSTTQQHQPTTVSSQPSNSLLSRLFRQDGSLNIEALTTKELELLSTFEPEDIMKQFSLYKKMK